MDCFVTASGPDIDTLQHETIFFVNINALLPSPTHKNHLMNQIAAKLKAAFFQVAGATQTGI